MRSITSVHLTNFQSHADSVIYLAPGGQLTILTGPSDVGKTALLRGLRWVLYNEPEGTEFFRHGTTICQVEVTYDDGWCIRRLRTPSKNQYIVTAPNTTQPQVYEGFGSSVPFQVAEITGVSQLSIGGVALSLNLSGQLEGPFLGSSIPATARARILGTLAGTEEIDLAARDTGTDIYRAGQEERRLGDEIQRLETVIASYSWVDPLGERIGQADALLTAFEELRARADKLRTARESMDTIKRRLDQMSELMVRYARADMAASVAVDALSLCDRRRVLAKLGIDRMAHITGLRLAEETRQRAVMAEVAYAAIDQAAQYVSKEARLATLSLTRTIATDRISTLPQIIERGDRAEKVLEILTAAALGVNRVISLKKRHDICQLTRRSISDYTKAIDTCGRAIIEAEQEYHDYLRELGVCPICGQQIA